MMASKPRMIAINLIVADPNIQPRAAMSPEVVADYASDPDALPAIDVFEEGVQFIIGDGFHRHAGYVAASRTEVPCSVHKGGRRAAALFALAANARHGLRRSSADKRRAIEKMLRDDEWRHWTDHRIADHCHVDPKTVRNQRAELESTGEIPPAEERTGSDGRRISVAGNGRVSSGENPQKPAHSDHARNETDTPATTVVEVLDGDTIESIREEYEERQAIQDDIPDEEWVKQFPLHSELQNHALRNFHSAAILFRAIEPHRRTFAHHATRVMNARRGRRDNEYEYRIKSFLSLPDPSQWLKCVAPEHGGCGGIGCVPGLSTCPECHGRGFRIPHGGQRRSRLSGGSG